MTSEQAVKTLKLLARLPGLDNELRDAIDAVLAEVDRLKRNAESEYNTLVATQRGNGILLTRAERAEAALREAQAEVGRLRIQMDRDTIRWQAAVNAQVEAKEQAETVNVSLRKSAEQHYARSEDLREQLDDVEAALREAQEGLERMTEKIRAAHDELEGFIPDDPDIGWQPAEWVLNALEEALTAAQPATPEGQNRE